MNKRLYVDLHVLQTVPPAVSIGMIREVPKPPCMVGFGELEFLPKRGNAPCEPCFVRSC